MTRIDQPSPSAARLPPLLTPHLAEPGADPFAHACKLAAAGSLGAGDVVLAPGVEAARMAIVLEPDVDARTSRQMAPLLMVATADSLGALLPPKVAIEHRWPGRILLNGGCAGLVRLGLPDGSPSSPPPWLVLAVDLALATAAHAAEPGTTPDLTCIAEEGGAELLAEDVLSSVAAHFLTWLDIWQSDGFAPVARGWMFRAEGRTTACKMPGPRGAIVASPVALLPDARLQAASLSGEKYFLEWSNLAWDEFASSGDRGGRS